MITARIAIQTQPPAKTCINFPRSATARRKTTATLGMSAAQMRKLTRGHPGVEKSKSLKILHIHVSSRPLPKLQVHAASATRPLQKLRVHVASAIVAASARPASIPGNGGGLPGRVATRGWRRVELQIRRAAARLEKG